MNQLRIKQIAERYYDNLELILNNIVPGFDIETVHNFRLTYKNFRGFIRMLGEQEADKIKLKISRKLRKTYNLLGQIRNLDLQKIKITNHQNANYSLLQHYLTILGDEINRRKQKLLKALSKEPLKKGKKNAAAFLPTDFSIINFQIYVQLKLAAIISIVESSHISDKNIHTIRKELDDLYYNHKKFEEGESAVSLAPIFEGKDDKHFLKLLEELGAYHDICTSVMMIQKKHVKNLKSNERAMIKTIQSSWLKDKRVMKDALVAKLEKEIHSINTYKEYNTEASNFAGI